MDNTFVSLKPRQGWSFAPCSYWRLFRHRENIVTHPMRDLIYQIYLSREDMRVYLGEFIRRPTITGHDPNDFGGDGVMSDWEWDELDVDPYSPDCFDKIWNHLR
jgi:hypothetical protein